MMDEENMELDPEEEMDEIIELTPEALERLKAIYAIVQSYNLDRSDSMSDYFDVGFWLDIDVKMPKDFQVREFMTEEEKASVYAWEAAEEERRRQELEAYHRAANPKSGRVMEKAGMHFDGILRGSKKNNLGLHDTAYYSVLRNDIVMREQYEKLFLSIHPGFFERDYVKRVPEDESASEMFLRLQEFDPECYQKDLPENVTFGCYNGDFEELLAAVGEVIPHWVPLFSKESRVYCGFVDGKIASFCMIENFGEHVVDGMTWKIGGPGCVGTVPAYRDRGIGLSMVRNVTQILREELYDYGYIHYTYETKWYGKLGYKTILSWNGKGFVS